MSGTFEGVRNAAAGLAGTLRAQREMDYFPANKFATPMKTDHWLRLKMLPAGDV